MPSDLLNLIAGNVPIIALLAWLYAQERKERRQAEAALRDCLKQRAERAEECAEEIEQSL